jgi:hypothetical protein
VPTPEGVYFNATVCEPGRYCIGGVATPCPAGRYGDQPGGRLATCVGNCSQGYFCSGGSVRSDQQPCGSAGVFCPAVRMFTSWREHGVVWHGREKGEHADVVCMGCVVDCCVGVCVLSYVSCACFWFVQGTVLIQLVAAGSYSEPESGPPALRYFQTLCPVGYYCVGGVRRACSAGRFGASQGATDVGACSLCPAGTYGATVGLPSVACSGPCDAGRFGASPGLTSPLCDSPCPAGRYGGPGEVSPSCTGNCTAGHYCVAGSTNATAAMCAPGTYSLSGWSQCQPCAGGYFCPQVAAPRQPPPYTCVHQGSRVLQGPSPTPTCCAVVGTTAQVALPTPPPMCATLATLLWLPGAGV